LGLFRFR